MALSVMRTCPFLWAVEVLVGDALQPHDRNVFMVQQAWYNSRSLSLSLSLSSLATIRLYVRKVLQVVQ
jgi:hypothetical protein